MTFLAETNVVVQAEEKEGQRKWIAVLGTLPTANHFALRKKKDDR